MLLSTAPDPTGATHWGQQTFSLHPAVDCAPGDALVGRITVVRKKENHRLMEVGPPAQRPAPGSQTTNCRHTRQPCGCVACSAPPALLHCMHDITP